MSKVSVIIPNYNHARFLKRRVQSIFAQTYKDFEVIYLDDASTDNSNQVFSELCQGRAIKTIFNSSNSGSPFKQWKKGIENSNGEYIWIAESDDFADAKFLETLVPILDNNRNVGLAYCQSFQVDESDRTVSTLHSWTDSFKDPRWQSDFINDGRHECQRYLSVKNTVPNASAVLCRRSEIEKVNLDQSSLRLSGDWLTWVQMLLKSDIAYTAKLLNYFRIHHASVRETTAKFDSLIEQMKIFALINSEIFLDKTLFLESRNSLIREGLMYALEENKFGHLKRFMSVYQAAKKIDTKSDKIIFGYFKEIFRNKLRYSVSRFRTRSN